MFLYEKTHRYLKNDYQFFDIKKDRKIRGNCNLLIKVKFHELEESPTITQVPASQECSISLAEASFIVQ